ncbi:MAG: hypothetical protein SwBeaBPW_07900 [Shewanella algae]
MTNKPTLNNCGTLISPFALLLLLLFPLLPLPAAASANQVEQAARQYLQQQLQQFAAAQQMKPLQSKIRMTLPSGVKRLPDCPQTPDISLANASAPLWGRVSLEVRCPAADWRFFLRARVEAKAQLPVLTQTLHRGSIIEAQNIEWRSLELQASDRDIVSSQRDLIGKQVARRIRAGEAILLRQLSQSDWVRAGEQVIIQVSQEGFEAQMPGTALESASRGEVIRVRNLSSQKVIKAYPIAQGIVTPQK